jgi:SAM-dependent methyltransferase
MPGGINDYDRGAKKGMICRHLPAPLRIMPRAVQRYVLHFESSIENAVTRFAETLPPGATVLDAGAGEGQYASVFIRHRYVGVDRGIGDSAWNYRALDAIADLSILPFASNAFDACVNIVTLEHVQEPAAVLAELFRALRPGGQILLVTPHEWEEHQEPHDYFRYTRYGLDLLLRRAGFHNVVIEPVGGFFRLLSRRLLNGVQFFPGPLALVAALAFGPPALVLPLLDGLDHRRNFTLGHVCTARKP